MAEVMIVVLGFLGVLTGLEKLSALSVDARQPHVSGLLVAALMQVVGCTLSMLCTSSGDFTYPLALVLGGLVVWSFSDRRKFQRREA